MMYRGAFLSNIKRNNFYFCILIPIWIAGLLVGIISYDPYVSSLMSGVILQPVSVVGLLGIIFLPLFVVYVSFVLNEPIVSLIVCFLKAVAFGFSGNLIAQNYGSASWLVRVLLQFSDHCCFLLLFVLWHRNFCTFTGSRSKSHMIIFLLVVPIAVLDYFVISPFLRGLF